MLDNRKQPGRNCITLKNHRLLKAQGVGRVILAGVFAHACVKATARGALRRGYRVAILKDGVATTSHRRRTAALRRMQQMGAEVVTCEQVLSSGTDARIRGAAG